jgi:glycosyltransferase involved in cell wall biosynthesis
MHDLTTLRFPNPSKNKLVFKTKQRAYRLVNYVAAHKSRIIITPSQFVKDDVAKLMRINSRKIEVTYEAGTRIEAEAEPIPTLVDTQFIMYVGRPNPHKNLERLIDAFVLLQASHPDLHLVLAGKKDELFKRHARRVSQSEITNVDFTDRVSDGQLRWLYENCAAYVFPSLSEGFGLPGLEAMAHGAPVVSSNVTCLPEIYGEAAHYFDPLDTEAMCIAINDVLDNTRLRNRLLAASSDQIKKYSWKKMAEQTLKVYIRALE